MAHLHSLDILHGDLTAANILLTSSTGELTMRVPHHNYDAHHGTICDTVKAFMWVCHGVACGQLPEVRGPGGQSGFLRRLLAGLCLPGLEALQLVKDTACA